MKKTTDCRAESYISPFCAILGINSEGVLCSSIANLGDEFDYEWNTEE